MISRAGPKLGVGVFASAVLAAASPALAAEAGGDKGAANPAVFNIVQFVTAIVVFAIVLAILGRVVWPKILGGLEARREKIRSEIEKAEKARAEADEALKSYEQSLSEARQKAQAMIEETKAEQARMAAKLKAESEAELAEMKKSARRDIDAAKRAAVAEVYREAAAVSAAVAEKILGRELNESDQSRLVDETLEEIGREYHAGEPATTA
jgi:F-type H+-transporting ATPase subunit b